MGFNSHMLFIDKKYQIGYWMSKAVPDTVDT